MDVANGVRLGQGENVAVVEQILGCVREALAAGPRLVNPVVPDSGPHRTIEEGDARREEIVEFGGEVGSHPGATLARERNPRNKQINRSRYVDA